MSSFPPFLSMYDIQFPDVKQQENQEHLGCVQSSEQ